MPVRSAVRTLFLAVLVLFSAEIWAAARPAAAQGEPGRGTSLRDAVDAAASAIALGEAADAVGAAGAVSIAVADQQSADQLPADGDDARPGVAGVALDRPLGAASMVKLFIAEDVLRRARAGEVSLAPEDGPLLRDMLRLSDDPAASALWVRFGGGRMVSDVAARYGLTGTAPPERPGRWGDTRITARDLAVFLARLPVLAHPDDAAAILGWMREVTPRAADGFDQGFGLATLPGAPAVKQGWMCCPGDRRHVYSAGVVGGRAVVVLGDFSPWISDAAARAGITAVTAALPLARDVPARC